jgi:hypothetical protein
MDPLPRLAAPLPRMRAASVMLVWSTLQGSAYAGGGAWAVPRPVSSADAIEPRDAAAAEFARGEDAYRSGDYERASEHFARAYALVPHPSTLYNLGMAQERAGDRVAAWNTYDRLARDALTPSDRRDALAARERVRSDVALLELRASSSSAVCLDGEHVDVDTSLVIATRPGAHEIRVGDDTAIVELRAGETHTVELGRDALLERTTRGSRAIVPLLVTTTIGAGAATGLGGAAAASTSPSLRQGLAAGAAAASGIALGTAIAALVLHTRPRRARRTDGTRDRERATCPRPRGLP